MAYMGSLERELTREEIVTSRLEDLPDWNPLWRQLAEKDKQIRKIRDLPEAILLARRAQMDEEYQMQLDRERGERVAVRFAQIRPARMTVIIGASIDAGWDAQDLVEAEREFAVRLFEGRVDIIQSTGFGYREFLQWIASKPSLNFLKSETVEAARRTSFVLKPVAIKNWMPPDFEDFGAQDDLLYEQWRAKTANGTLRSPETEKERLEAFKGLLKRLCCPVVREFLGMTNQEEYIDHPFIVHYGWFLVKREKERINAARRKAVSN